MTLNAELLRIDGEIASRTRARFAALARCDAGAARHFASKIAELKRERADLIHGKPLFQLKDE